jgi:plasmid stabilization system protein ParE
VSRIILSDDIADDFDRILDHFARHDSAEGPAQIAAIVEAIDILADHPEIGRPAGRGKRELIIGRGVHGFIALYRFVPSIDTVFVFAIRAQREGGYGRAV